LSTSWTLKRRQSKNIANVVDDWLCIHRNWIRKHTSDSLEFLLYSLSSFSVGEVYNLGENPPNTSSHFPACPSCCRFRNSQVVPYESQWDPVATNHIKSSIWTMGKIGLFLLVGLVKRWQIPLAINSYRGLPKLISLK
jgi:hypothetical protein